MKISLLAHNLSANNLVRLYPIAKTLERFAEVEVLGFAGPAGIFPPYRDEFDYRAVPAVRGPRVLDRVKELRRLITGDVLYAFKPHPLSLGAALAERKASGRPVILDVEDFDLAFQYMRGWPALLKNALLLWDPDSFTWLSLTDRRARRSDAVTVVSTFLQRRYGGTLLPHGADTAIFDPARFDRAAVRRRWGVEGFRTILFAGKASYHKGTDDLVALARTLSEGRPDPPVRLLLVGGSSDDAAIHTLLSAGEGLVIHIPAQPHARMPEILTLADLVVLPQKDTLFARAQVPGKIFEAMAMGIPVVATAVSDLPDILAGCGIVVPPDDFPGLARAAGSLLDDPARAGDLGANARGRAVECYSWDAMETILREVFRAFSGR